MYIQSFTFNLDLTHENQVYVKYLSLHVRKYKRHQNNPKLNLNVLFIRTNNDRYSGWGQLRGTAIQNGGR